VDKNVPMSGGKAKSASQQKAKGSKSAFTGDHHSLSGGYPLTPNPPERYWPLTLRRLEICTCESYWQMGIMFPGTHTNTLMKAQSTWNRSPAWILFGSNLELAIYSHDTLFPKVCNT